jgi:cobaltochelatase CobT
MKELMSAFAKAVNKDEEISVEIQESADNFFALNQNIVKNSNTIIIPKNIDLDDSRAISDLGICYLLFHDKKIHIYDDFSLDEQKIIDDFEKIRVISKIKNDFSGVFLNITKKIVKDIDFALIGDSFSHLQLILLNQIFEKENPIEEILQDLQKNFDSKIVKKIAEIAKNIDNQAKFLQKTKDFLHFLQKEDENEQKEQEKPEKSEPSTNEENIESKTLENDDSANEDQETTEIEQKQQKPEEKITEFLQDENKASDFATRAISRQNKEEKIEFKRQYKIFSSKFDEIILPNKLISHEELSVLRMQLDLKIDNLDSISKRLTLKLKKKLLSKQKISVEQSESQGVVDRKKLTQIVTNPFDRNFFIKENFHNYQDTIVTILLDNSGSMRGSPIVMSALACEIIIGILEKFGLKTEILGFTTSDWKGGKSKKMWERQGKEKNPGRLNDLRHIIYKSANQNFQKAKINLGLMLKEGVLKENIDGEALLWARCRLMQREEKRKILMIISDGTPVDDSTNSANESEILIDHLHQVINKIDKEGKIEMVGIGIGHNVGAFYQNAITIKNSDELGDVMIEKLVDLI